MLRRIQMWWRQRKHLSDMRRKYEEEQEREENAAEAQEVFEGYATPIEALEAARTIITRASTKTGGSKCSKAWCEKACSALLYLESQLEGGKVSEKASNVRVISGGAHRTGDRDIKTQKADQGAV